MVRGSTAAFSRKQRGDGREIAVKEDVSDKKPDADAKARSEGKAEAKAEGKPGRAEAKPDAKAAASDAKSDAKAPPGDPKAATPSDAKPDAKAATPSDAKPDTTIDKAAAETAPIAAKPDPKDLPAIEPPSPKDEPWPDATPTPMQPVEPGDAVRTSRTATVGIPSEADLGRPPEMPRSAAPPPLALGSVEDPTHMPGPKDVPSGSPSDPAPPPGRVPPGDSRSLRRGSEFALVYRVGTCVITRTGTVGQRGQWRVVEYPTTSFASNSYAKECSRFVSEGFSDYRD